MTDSPDEYDEFKVIVPVRSYLHRRRGAALPTVEWWIYPHSGVDDTYNLDQGISALHVFNSQRVDHQGHPLPDIVGLPLLAPMIDDTPRMDLGWNFLELVAILPKSKIEKNIPKEELDGEIYEEPWSDQAYHRGDISAESEDD